MSIIFNLRGLSPWHKSSGAGRIPTRIDGMCSMTFEPCCPGAAAGTVGIGRSDVATIGMRKSINVEEYA